MNVTDMENVTELMLLSKPKDPQRREPAAKLMLVFAYQYIFSWLVPFQYLAGCTGTLLCIIVLVRRHSTQKEVRSWFIALSVMDIYVMTIGLPIMYTNIMQLLTALNLNKTEPENGTYSGEQVSTQVYTPYDPRTWSKLNCYIISILQSYGLLGSSWVQVGISLLRCISTVIPLSSRSHINASNSRRALCTTMLVTLAVSIIIVITTVDYTPINNQWTCGQTRKSPYLFYSIFVLRVFLPSVCLIVSTSVILYSLQKFKRAFHIEARRRTLQQRRISLILIGMNISFLLFALPYEIHLIYGFIIKDYLISKNMVTQSIEKILQQVFAILMYTNNATNWIFYFVLGKRFRQEMRYCLTCNRNRVSKTVHYRFHLAPRAAAERTPGDELDKRVCLGENLCTSNRNRQVSSSQSGANEMLELQPLQDSPIGETRKVHSYETTRCHANHRVCHVHFKTSV